MGEFAVVSLILKAYSYLLPGNTDIWFVPRFNSSKVVQLPKSNKKMSYANSKINLIFLFFLAKKLAYSR